MERVALVTGSSRGLGAAIAARLVRDGLKVFVNSLPGNPELATIASAIGATPIYADVTDPSDIKELASSVGPLDVLVLNATGPQPNIALFDTTWSDHLDQLRFFVESPILLLHALVPGMISRGYGRIVHIDSEVADRPALHRSAYVTAKAAQVGLARSWARELGPSGITVNTVAPGFVPVERHNDVPGSARAAYTATVPLGRMGLPEDVAHAVSFFASEGAGFVTGQRVVVDGGRHLGP
ncbi:SDR family oxidoreductase [Actinocrispum wychmicini]|uniref:3-oxoacyl-[acyl-carrier protein] reductase n=1 Tax=Actinocrispum wychmicini TaxID=1213861 RepID=A0A4R2JQX2_9PSEU|nr:SDR family oxidoreductase [Actinocrispum wychmicini]TCO62643.1 3-oxoacyl-[acyl-carrier protein] reductase [Actinocrispum wychmicini]